MPGDIEKRGEIDEIKQLEASHAPNIAQLSGKYAGFMLFGLLGVIIALVFWDVLLGIDLYLFKDIGSDTLNQFYPAMLHEQRYAAAEGCKPIWSFFQGIGQNLFSGYYYHPVDWLTAWIPVSDLGYRIIYQECVKILLTGICFFAYLRTIGLSGFVSLLCALCAGLTGYMIVGTSWYGHSLLILNAVFLLFAFEQYLLKGRWWFFPLAVYWVGVGPNLFFHTVFFVLYGLVRTLELELNGQKLARKVLVLLGLGLLGVALNMAGWFSAIDRILNSPRLGTGLTADGSLENATLFGLESQSHYLTAIARLFGNDLMGNGSSFVGWRNYLEAPLFYCGILTLLLVPQAIASAKPKVRLAYVSLLSFWVLLIIFPYFRYSFYLFSGDLYKSGVSLFFPLSLLYVAAQGLEAVLDPERQGPNKAVLLLSMLFFAVLAMLPYLLDRDLLQEGLLFTSIAILLVESLLLLALTRQSFRSWVPGVLLILVCAELTFVAYSTVNDRVFLSSKEFEARTGYNDYTKEALAFIDQQENGFYRVEKDYTSSLAAHYGLNDTKAQGYFGTTSYASFNNPYYIKFLEAVGEMKEKSLNQLKWLSGVRSRPILQPLLAVKYNLSKQESSFYEEYGYAQEVARFGDVKVLKNKHALPLGFAYDKFMVQSDFEGLENKQRGIALLKAFIPDEATRGLGGLDRFNPAQISAEYDFQEFTADTGHERGVFNVEKFSHNQIEGSIEVSGRRMLFFSIPFDRGWSATVNGKATKPACINVGFLGLDLKDAGTHKIILRYAPPNLTLGWIISIIALLIYLCLLAYPKLKRS